jgi:hypothetical protein
VVVAAVVALALALVPASAQALEALALEARVLSSHQDVS